MSSTIRVLVLSFLAMLPLQLRAQTMQPVQPMQPMPIDLGFIPVGEERMFQLIGRLNLETASQEQAMAAVQRTMFSVAEDSGFCIALMAPAQATMLFLVGRERMNSPVLFDVNTGPNGISSAEGRRTLLQSVGPIPQTTFLLASVVGQTSTAPGDTLTVFVRAYPDTTPQNAVAGICGPNIR